MKSDSGNYVRSLRGTFYKTIAISACAHVLILVTILYGKLLPSGTREYNPVYTVKLVSTMQQAQAEGTSIPAGSTRQAVNATPQIPAQRMILPIGKKAPGRKELLSAIRHISSEVKRKELLKAINENARGQGSTIPGNNTSASASSGSGAPTGSAAEQYYAVIWHKIQSAWLIPSNMADASYGYETVVSITINKDGTVTGISVEKGSGNEYFDQTAIRAIKKASPLPPFPPSWLQKSIDIGIKFSCKEGCK